MVGHRGGGGFVTINVQTLFDQIDDWPKPEREFHFYVFQIIIINYFELAFGQLICSQSMREVMNQIVDHYITLL